MGKEKVIQILMNRDNIDREEATALINETVDEMIMNPTEADEIIMNYLGLESDYIEDILGY